MSDRLSGISVLVDSEPLWLSLAEIELDVDSELHTELLILSLVEIELEIDSELLTEESNNIRL